MRHTYYFKDSVDNIDSEILTKSNYKLLVNDIIELNKDFHYPLYLYGSYIGFLIEKKEYNDINFIILSEKIIEVSDLTRFFLSFHQICKKHKVGYDLAYSIDKRTDDFDTDLYSGYLFKDGMGKLIRLYKSINSGISFEQLEGTDLYEGTLPPITQKLIKKMQMGVKFYTPIKIQ